MSIQCCDHDESSTGLQCQTAADRQMKPVDLVCETTCMLLSPTPTITMCKY